MTPYYIILCPEFPTATRISPLMHSHVDFVALTAVRVQHFPLPIHHWVGQLYYLPKLIYSCLELSRRSLLSGQAIVFPRLQRPNLVGDSASLISSVGHGFLFGKRGLCASVRVITAAASCKARRHLLINVDRHDVLSNSTRCTVTIFMIPQSQLYRHYSAAI